MATWNPYNRIMGVVNSMPSQPDNNLPNNEVLVPTQRNLNSLEETYRRMDAERRLQIKKTPSYYPTHEETFMNPLRMIAMRLHLKEGETMPFQSMNACKKTDGSYVIFVMHEDNPIILEDGAELFPSDTLISQLHLLMK